MIKYKNNSNQNRSNAMSDQNTSNSSNIINLKIELSRLKKRYELESQNYKKLLIGITETEKKINIISKKINKIEYKQIILSNDIDDEYILKLNKYDFDLSEKLLLLNLLGYQFPNEEILYFDSPENLIAQFSLSKEILFDLLNNKKSEFDSLKMSYKNLKKQNNFLKIIFNYIDLNFEIIDLLKKRKNILEDNYKYIKEKDKCLILCKSLEKKIKETFKLIKNNFNNKSIDSTKTNKKIELDSSKKHSKILNVKEFDEISGKSFIMSLSNDNAIIDLFKDEKICKDKNYGVNFRSYNVEISNSNNIEISNDVEINKNKKNNNFAISPYNVYENRNNKIKQFVFKSPNTFIKDKFKNVQKNINNNSLYAKSYRSPQHKTIDFQKDGIMLKIEKPVEDSGCCSSCT